MSKRRDRVIDIMAATIVAPLIWSPIVATTLWLGWWSLPIWSAMSWLYLVRRPKR